jgi:hypothetical protein
MPDPDLDRELGGLVDSAGQVVRLPGAADIRRRGTRRTRRQAVAVAVAALILVLIGLLTFVYRPNTAVPAAPPGVPSPMTDAPLWPSPTPPWTPSPCGTFIPNLDPSPTSPLTCFHT